MSRLQRIAYSGFLYRDLDIVNLVEKHKFELVAIDAPLSLPKGLCCLRESCGCQAELDLKGRACERQLAGLGIPCYFTTKKSIIRDMVYRGIKLKAQLESAGYRVIEVYPYASKRRLFRIKKIPPKTTAEGLHFLRRGIAELLPHLSPHVEKFNHDMCDAAVAAYTAFLHSRGKTELIGDATEGAIIIPFSGPVLMDW
jgi:predicted nuclease with RNAse H fold